MTAHRRVRIPNEGEKITRKSAEGTEVYLAVRQVPHRALSSRVEPLYEAELRELVGDAYVTVGRVTRSTKAEAIDAASALARKRGWVISPRRIYWTTRDAAYERELAEIAADLAPAKKETP